MKIDKAIELLKELPDTCNNDLGSDQQDAVKLGIAALTRIQKYRRDPCHAANIPLYNHTCGNLEK